MEDFTLRNNFRTAYHIAKANQIQFSFQVSNVAQGTEKKSIYNGVKKTVVKFAMEDSNRSAAQKFSVEPKRVIELRVNFEKIISAKSSKQRLEMRRRECFDSDLEKKLVAWVYEQRGKMLHVSRKMTELKANKKSLTAKTKIQPYDKLL